MNPAEASPGPADDDDRQQRDQRHVEGITPRNTVPMEMFRRRFFTTKMFIPPAEMSPICTDHDDDANHTGS